MLIYIYMNPQKMNLKFFKVIYIKCIILRKKNNNLNIVYYQQTNKIIYNYSFFYA